MSETRTASQLLMEALEAFGTAEPNAIIVVFTDEDGDISLLSECTLSQGIGLCKYAEESFIRRMFQKPE